MSSLKPPFQAINQEELKIQIKNAKLQRIPSRYSDSLWEIIITMLEKDPKNRASANELLQVKNVKLTLRMSKLRNQRLSLLHEIEKLNNKYIELEEKLNLLNQIEKKYKIRNENKLLN